MPLISPHSLPLETCLEKLEARLEGLTELKAMRRSAVHGPNRLPEVQAHEPALRFLAQFQHVLIYVLIGAAVVTGVLQHWVDTGVILTVVLANAVIGFVQEGKAETAMATIRGMLAPRAAVLRNRTRVTVNGADLVPGDVVLADDNFASIAAAVREGRTVYDNLKKVISFELPTSAGEALTITLALLLGISLPITAVQILWINLITGITLGIDLAFESTETGTMVRPPRPRHAPVLSGGLVWHVILVSLLFLAAVFGVFTYAIDKGYPLGLAQTMAMNTLVVLEIFHLFFIRNIHGTSLTWAAVRGTRIVWAVVVAITAAQFAVTYLPPLQAIFGTMPVPWVDGLLIVSIGAAFFAIIEVEKQIRLRLNGQPASDA